MTDWSRAGFHIDPPEPTRFLSLADFGGVGDGATPNNAAMVAAMAAAEGAMTLISIPAGNYLFTSGIILHDSVIVRGEGADNTTLTLSESGYGHGLRAVGSEDTARYWLTADVSRGSYHLAMASTAGLGVGDLVRLYRDDAELVVSSWALGTTGQLVDVTGVQPDGLDLASPLRAGYTLAGAAYAHKIRPVRYCGIECMRIVRTDATIDQWSNIFFQRASHCWVRGVESVNCNFSHIDLFTSANCEVSGCYLHDAFDYGNGGKAYGVMAYFTAGENYVYDNIFKHLRHSMIVETGANGNVFAYNRSLDPYWTDVALPANSSGEIVLHGDHPYLNLFEGNVVQNISIDDSHGRNGPFNTLFRNRASLWGILMNNAPATDSMNIVGNEVTGLYVLNGVGHLAFGNIANGTVTPAGTGTLPDLSYYLPVLPAFLQPIGALPQVGPGSLTPGTIPAALRYASGSGFTVCTYPDINTGARSENHFVGEVHVYPVPFTDHIRLTGAALNGAAVAIVLYNAVGGEVARYG
ncbi:MAG: glycosyl hydrolase family 28-related protein, partial [Flavobacteriales bacterium]